MLLNEKGQVTVTFNGFSQSTSHYTYTISVQNYVDRDCIGIVVDLANSKVHLFKRKLVRGASVPYIPAWLCTKVVRIQFNYISYE